MLSGLHLDTNGAPWFRSVAFRWFKVWGLYMNVAVKVQFVIVPATTAAVVVTKCSPNSRIKLVWRRRPLPLLMVMIAIKAARQGRRAVIFAIVLMEQRIGITRVACLAFVFTAVAVTTATGGARRCVITKIVCINCRYQHSRNARHHSHIKGYC